MREPFRSVASGESVLVSRFLDGVLREDVGGLRTAGVRYRRSGRPDREMLAFGALRLPVRPGDPAADLLADLVVREPWLEMVQVQPSILRACRPRRLRRLAAVVNALRDATSGDPDLAAGWLDLRTEALAAFDDHPLHPLSAARVGLSAATVRRSAPEHRAHVVPGWVRVPRDRAEVSGDLPPWWPQVKGGVAVPVHPATDSALLPGYAEPLHVEEPVGGPATLSMRTLAITAAPGSHLKLPMPVRTLGRLNLRRIGHAGLRDGVLVQRLLGAVLRREPDWAARVSVADESTWVWAGDPMLAAMLRRLPAVPPGRADGVRLPVAALAARGISGRSVAVELAGTYWDGDLLAFLGDYLDTLLGWHLLLWLRRWKR